MSEHLHFGVVRSCTNQIASQISQHALSGKFFKQAGAKLMVVIVSSDFVSNITHVLAPHIPTAWNTTKANNTR